MVQWVWGSESRHNGVCKDWKKSSLYYPFMSSFRIILTPRDSSHSLSVARLLCSGDITPFSLPASSHLSYRPLFKQHKIEWSGGDTCGVSPLSGDFFFPAAYTQFMSNYGCQCGREIGEAFICPLAWFSISSVLLSSSLPVQVITAHLNA